MERFSPAKARENFLCSLTNLTHFDRFFPLFREFWEEPFYQQIQQVTYNSAQGIADQIVNAAVPIVDKALQKLY